MRYGIIKLFLFAVILTISTSCETLFFHPQQALLYSPAVCSQQPENYVIETEDGIKLHSWLFRTKKEKKGVIFFMHGNSRNIGTESLGMLWVLDRGYDLFTFDYRGYGLSEGKPSISGILSDGVDAIDAFMEIEQLDKTNLILYGQSLGGAAATYAAANSQHADRFKALVLDSTFSSWRDIAQDAAAKIFITWPFQYPIGASFSKYSGSNILVKSSKIQYIVLMHSRKDTLIDIRHAENLYAAINGHKKLILSEDAAHARMIAETHIRNELMEYLDSVISE